MNEKHVTWLFFFFHNLVWKMFQFVWFGFFFNSLVSFAFSEHILQSQSWNFTISYKLEKLDLANVTRHFNTHIWSVFQVGQSGFFFPASLLINFHFSHCIFFSTSLHLLYPPLLVLIPSFFPSHSLHLFLLLLTSLHSYFSFSRSSLTNSPFFHRLIFFFLFLPEEADFFFFWAPAWQHGELWNSLVTHSPAGQMKMRMLLLTAAFARCCTASHWIVLTRDRKFGDFLPLAMTIF